MRSPLATLLLVVLGWPVIVLSLVGGYSGLHHWLAREYPRPARDDDDARVQYSGYHHIAVDALRSLRALAPAEQQAIVQRLDAAISTPERWLDSLDRTRPVLLCLGEQHDERTRRFLARRVFPRLPLDMLTLEATATDLANIRVHVTTGRTYYPLLGADISGVLKAVLAKSPATRIEAVDETDAQHAARMARADQGFRDDSMTDNLLAVYRSGSRTAMLFGAFHCLNEPRMLYSQVRVSLPATEADEMHSLRVMGEHEGGPVEAFVYFLDELGLPAGDLALPDPSALPSAVARWFPLFSQETLERYDTVMVYRVGA
jgi:hypothetical protein